MNRLSFFIIALLISAGLSGCQSPYMRDQLALFGGLTGAGVGAALSNGNSNVGENAALGAVVGTLAGAAFGDHMDEIEARNQALFQQHLGRQLSGSTSINDVIAMSQAGLSEEVIRTHITNHGMAKQLTTQNLITLKQQGVNDAVIQAMQSTFQEQGTPPPPVVVEEHYYTGPRPPAYWIGHHHSHPRHRYRHPRISWGLSFHR